MRVMFIVNDLGINEPFGPMILSAVLKAKGHETILGALQEEDVAAKIRHWKPDLLAYSMMSVDMLDFRKFNREIKKETGIFTLLGGAHATLDRHSCFPDPDLDAICVGEGEQAIADLVDRLDHGQSLEGLPNIMFDSDAPLNLNKFLPDMDAIPFMDRELVYAYPKMAKFGIKGIWSSRGCPFPCPYCFNNRYNQLYTGKGAPVRRRSVGNVIEEMKLLKENYRVDFVRMQDDVFIYKADEWMEEFSKRWPSEIGIPYYALIRSELVTDELAVRLKESGCFSICMSIESANDQVRKKMMRRRVEKEKLADAFRILRQHDINVYANTMLALPFTSLETDIECVDFAIEVQPDFPNFSIFMPYPGTDLGDFCKDEGIYDHENDNLYFGMRNESVLSCFSPEEKRAQYNLCQLAIVAVKLPFLRNLIINHLIHMKPNRLFFMLHYAFAVTIYGRKIFKYDHSLKEYVELVFRTLKHYLYDFTKDGVVEDPVEKARARSGDSAGSRATTASDLQSVLTAMAGASYKRRPAPATAGMTKKQCPELSLKPELLT